MDYQPSPNTKLKESLYGLMQPLPAGAMLSHYQYRLRPYRHWVTFQNVSLEQGKTSDVRVKVETVASSPPDDARVEAAPKRISFQEAKELVERLGDQCNGDSQSDEPVARVQLGGEKVDDAMIRKLAGYPKLKSLWLIGMVSITDDGLAALSQSASLEFLQFSSKHVTDEGMTHLASLKTLNGLGVMGVRLTDESLKAIGACENLGFLELSDTQITDAGLEHPAALPSLAYLSIDGAAITDAGVVVLKQASLATVSCLRCPQLTAAGKKAWQTAAPQIQISGDFPESKVVKKQ